MTCICLWYYTLWHACLIFCDTEVICLCSTSWCLRHPIASGSASLWNGDITASNPCLWCLDIKGIWFIILVCDFFPVILWYWVQTIIWPLIPVYRHSGCHDIYISVYVCVAFDVYSIYMVSLTPTNDELICWFAANDKLIVPEVVLYMLRFPEVDGFKVYSLLPLRLLDVFRSSLVFVSTYVFILSEFVPRP